MKGAYKFKNAKDPQCENSASGLTLRFALSAEDILSKMNINVEIWSVTSFNELAREGTATDREKLYGIYKKESYVEECFRIPTANNSSFRLSKAICRANKKVG